MKIAATVLALLAADPAWATQEYVLPTLFDVSGVAADDVLNVRAAPSADAEIIGTLAPDAERVEVVAHDASGRWGQVNINGRSGWASLRYLAYRTDVWQTGELPRHFSCTGTEPFWSLSTDGGTLSWSTPEGETTYAIQAIEVSGVFRDPRRALSARSDGERLTAVAVPAWCSDGMSDRAYGLDATIALEHEDGLRLLRGCCSIAPDPASETDLK